MIRAHPSRWSELRLIAPVALLLLAASCTPHVDDPMAALRTTPASPESHLLALSMLDERPASEEYTKELHRIIWVPGYNNAVREAALERLEQRDLPGLQRTIRQHLPQMRMPMWSWLTHLCEVIADRQWTELTPALISSWARNAPMIDDLERPEYHALADLHGADQVTDVVFDLMLESNKVSQQGLRTRCWDLLHRLGERERLIALLASSQIPEDDIMLLDLQAAAVDLGLVPHNREEILWLRELRQPEHRTFWDQARQTIAGLSEVRRRDIGVRDVPILVSAQLHAPELLESTREQLYESLSAYLADERHHVRRLGDEYLDHQRLFDYRDKLTWGDLAAMHIALRALRVPQVVEHLFDYAARDREDETTEYGGVIRLDEQGRFEIREFLPRIRRHDQAFLAPQEMLDAAYTAPFHFHFHVQRNRNGDYAGPGPGDQNYADNTRANCLVFTSVRKGVMNVDYYRYGRVVVDLGEIERHGD